MVCYAVLTNLAEGKDTTMADKVVEASIKLPDGTEISVKGSRGHVSEIISTVAKERTRRADHSSASDGQNGRLTQGAGKLENVVEKDPDGRVHIVATDLKVKTAIDAAHRVIYLALLGRRQLLNESKTSRKAVVEALRNWNLYDGNSRRLIARDRALVRDGRKTVALSNPALQEAWKFVKEIQDVNVKGDWTPTGGRGRGKRSRRRSTKPE